jgi:hypothetical protein
MNIRILILTVTVGALLTFFSADVFGAGNTKMFTCPATITFSPRVRGNRRSRKSPKVARHEKL